MRLFIFLFFLFLNSFNTSFAQEIIQEFEKACHLNDGGGCFNLGLLYSNGQGVKQDYFKAKELFGKTCDLKLQLGCDNYAKLTDDKIFLFITWIRQIT